MAGSGGAWKVAYADFVTAMMAFFMVMWLTSQKPELKEAVSDYFRNPSGRQLTGNPNSSLLPSRNESSGGRRARTRGKEAQANETKMTSEGKRTNVGTIVNFEANSIVLSETGRQSLEDMLPELQGKPHRIEVRGHALSDTRQANDVSFDALNISFQRSLTTMQFLVDAGIEPNRIRLSQAGASEPRITGTDVDQSANARVEVYLLDETYEAASDKIQRMVSTKAAIAEADSKKIEEDDDTAHDSGHGSGHDSGHGQPAKAKSGH